MVDIREIKEPNEIEDFPRVIASAWSTPNMAAEFGHIINATRFHGGLALAAYDGDDIIGIQFSFPGYRRGRIYLYSHMTGVLEGKKYSGVGYGMKQFQKKWAIERGYDLIAWTFDPVRPLNAYFNIHKLGAVSRTLLPNFYGTMDDSLNAGIPTDRLVAEWWINSEPAHFDERLKPINEILDDGSMRYAVDIRDIDAESILLSVISDIPSLMKSKKEVVVVFKNHLTSAISKLFERGYVITDFSRSDGETGYVFSKASALEIGSKENIFRS